MKSYIYGLSKEQCNMVREPQQIQFHQTRYVYFPEEINNAVQTRIADQLQQALEQQQLQVFLQPRIHLPSETVCAAEALVRWQWPDGQWSLPQQFLPALEQTGLMPVLDFYMLEQTAALQQQWRKQYGWALPISVNVTADTLLQPQAAEQIGQIIRQAGLYEGQLELELTEHCLMEQQQALIPVLTQLRAQGIPICMDDFGTGSSSLSLLMQLPVDIVKMDRSFLEKDIRDDKMRQYIAQIVKLLQTAETGIVFEGVETAEQAEFLKAMAVNQGQGWYWERPLHWRAFQQQYCIDKPQKICYYI